MSEPFATVDDLEKRWHVLSVSERGQASVLLEDASALIRAQSPWQSLDSGLLRSIVCAMVKRAMNMGESAGVSATSQNVGGVSESFTFANPNGDLYFTTQERKLLKIGAQTARSLPLQKGL